MARRKRSETIECHDCGHAVSFSARACPRCGSSEPAGAYRWSRREARQFRAEQRNDRNLAVASLTLGAIGGFYGYAIGTGIWSGVLWATLYGLFGMILGVPVGFAINFLWRMHPP